MFSQHTHCICQVWAGCQHGVHESTERALIRLSIDFRDINFDKLHVGLKWGGDGLSVLQAETI